MLSYHLIRIQSTQTAIAYLLGFALLSLWPNLGNSTPALPILPQVYIDATYSPSIGNTITVNAGGDFQAALNNANLGDTIVLQAGATFTGTFTLPTKTTGSGWIYIVSSNYSSLPSPGNRVSPTDVVNMPTITSPYGNAGLGLLTNSAAHHYRFVGIEIRPTTGTYLWSIVSIGNGETSLAALPHDITIDRCYIHGDPTVGSNRGVTMNGASVAVVDSYISDIKVAGADTQAVASTNGPGPFKIVNNYLEAAGENVMFGGNDPGIANLVPSDIEIRNNYFFKPLSWMTQLTNGHLWTVKNLLEFKNAQRVLVEGNRFENNWPNAQDGASILITPRNQNGTAPWSVTQDITFHLNTLVNLASGFNILGTDNLNHSQYTKRLLIQNNVIGVTGVGGGFGRSIQISTDITDFTIDHNTILNTATGATSNLGISGGTGTKNNQFVFLSTILHIFIQTLNDFFNFFISLVNRLHNLFKSFFLGIKHILKISFTYSSFCANKS